MALASIFNVPDTPEEISQWAFAHMANHRDIIRIIYETTGIALPEFLLDPLNPNDTSVWEYGHQVMHRQMNEILGIEGNDLLGIDWNDQNKRAAWIQLNASEHRQACDLIGLG